MTDYVTPCADPANDPEDWYLDKDGRQYADVDLVTEEALAEAIVERDMLWADQGQVNRLRADLEIEAAKDGVVRRRHAKDACFTCYHRTLCLGKALDNREQFGIWGGYTPEERNAVLRLQDERRARRAARGTDPA